MFDPFFGTEDRRCGIIRASNPKIEEMSNPKPELLRAVRDGAVHGGTAGRGGDGQDGTPTGRFAQEITVPLTLQTIEEYPPRRVYGSTNKGDLFCSGRAQQGDSARDDYRHVTRQSTCTIFPRQTAAGGLEDDPSSAGQLPAA